MSVKSLFLKIASFAVLLTVGISAAGVEVYAKDSAFTPAGVYTEYDEKSSYQEEKGTASADISSDNSLGILKVNGDAKDEGSNTYYVQDGNLTLNYDIDLSALETESDKWHLTDDKSKAVNGVSLDQNILSGSIIVQSSLDGENWLVDATYTDVFSGNVDLSTPFFTTKDIHQLNGCYYRVTVAYKLQKQLEDKKILLWNTDNFEYKKVTETYTIFVVDQDTIDNKSASPDTKPRKEFKDKVNTGKDNGYDLDQATKVDEGDPHFGWNIGTFTVNGYTRETKEDDGTIVFLKTVGDNITLWFTLNQDINCLDGDDTLSIAEDKDGYDKAFEVKKTNFKHGTLIVKYTDEDGNSHDPVIYTDFLAANAVTGADTRVQLYEEGEYEVSLDYEVYSNPRKVGPVDVFPSTNDYKIYFKFSIRNGNTMAFPKDASTGSELKDGALTANGFTIDMALSKYLTIDVVRTEVNENADGTLSTSVRSNTVGKDGESFTKEGIYEITVKNQYSDGKPTTITLYVGTDKNVVALAKNHLTVDELNEYLKNGTTIDDDGTLLAPPEESTAEETEPAAEETIVSEEATAVTDNSNEVVQPENENASDNINADIENADEEADTAQKKTTPIFPFVIAGVIIAAGIGFIAIKRKKPEDKEKSE